MGPPTRPPGAAAPLLTCIIQPAAAKTRETLTDFYFIFNSEFRLGAAVHWSAPAPVSEGKVGGAPPPPPHSGGEMKDALKVRAVSAEGRATIMTALTCSRGAACSLKRSREEGIQWPLHSALCRHASERGAAHAESKPLARDPARSRPRTLMRMWLSLEESPVLSSLTISVSQHL